MRVVLLLQAMDITRQHDAKIQQYLDAARASSQWIAATTGMETRERRLVRGVLMRLLCSEVPRLH